MGLAAFGFMALVLSYLLSGSVSETLTITVSSKFEQAQGGVAFPVSSPPKYYIYDQSGKSYRVQEGKVFGMFVVGKDYQIWTTASGVVVSAKLVQENAGRSQLNNVPE